MTATPTPFSHGYSLSAIGSHPTQGKYPLTSPTISSRATNDRPGGYNELPWTGLLSPFVRIYYLLSLAWQVQRCCKQDTYLSPSPRTFSARCTIGNGFPGNQTTGISPTYTSDARFERKRISPRWNAGAMDSDITTTIGCVLAVTTERAFQSMKGVARTRRASRALLRISRLDIVGLT